MRWTLFSEKQARVGKAFLAETFHFEREVLTILCSSTILCLITSVKRRKGGAVMKEKKDIFQGNVKKEYYSKSY